MINLSPILSQMKRRSSPGLGRSALNEQKAISKAVWFDKDTTKTSSDVEPVDKDTTVDAKLNALTSVVSELTQVVDKNNQLIVQIIQESSIKSQETSALKPTVSKISSKHSNHFKSNNIGTDLLEGMVPAIALGILSLINNSGEIKEKLEKDVELLSNKLLVKPLGNFLSIIERKFTTLFEEKMQTMSKSVSDMVKKFVGNFSIKPVEEEGSKLVKELQSTFSPKPLEKEGSKLVNQIESKFAMKSISKTVSTEDLKTLVSEGKVDPDILKLNGAALDSKLSSIARKAEQSGITLSKSYKLKDIAERSTQTTVTTPLTSSDDGLSKLKNIANEAKNNVSSEVSSEVEKLSPSKVKTLGFLKQLLGYAKSGDKVLSKINEAYTTFMSALGTAIQTIGGPAVQRLGSIIKGLYSIAKRLFPVLLTTLPVLITAYQTNGNYKAMAKTLCEVLGFIAVSFLTNFIVNFIAAIAGLAIQGAMIAFFVGIFSWIPVIGPMIGFGIGRFLSGKLSKLAIKGIIKLVGMFGQAELGSWLGDKLYTSLFDGGELNQLDTEISTYLENSKLGKLLSGTYQDTIQVEHAVTTVAKTAEHIAGDVSTEVSSVAASVGNFISGATTAKHPSKSSSSIEGVPTTPSSLKPMYSKTATPSSTTAKPSTTKATPTSTILLNSSSQDNVPDILSPTIIHSHAVQLATYNTELNTRY